MKIFSAYGYTPSGCGCCSPDFDHDVIVIANTKSEALGLLLEQFPKTCKVTWSLSEVDLSYVHIDGY